MDALKILQSSLDELGTQVMTGDFAGYRRNIALPFHLVTETSSIVITTEAELKSGFDTFGTMLRTQHVSDMIRIAENADFLEPNLISGGYWTNLLEGGRRVVPPFRSRMVLRRNDDHWRVASITNSLLNRRWPILSPEVPPYPRTP